MLFVKEINTIIKEIESYFDLHKGSIQINTRKPEIKEPRQIAHYFAKEYTDLTLSKIGDLIGKKDHATVLHSVKTIKNLIDVDSTLKNDIEEIRKRIDFALALSETDLNINNIFMLKFGLITFGSNHKLYENTFTFESACKVAIMRGFSVSDITNYTGLKRIFVESIIVSSDKSKAIEMNALIDNILNNEI